MNKKFKNFNIGFMEYFDDTPNLKDSPTYAAIIGSDNNRGFCGNTNTGDETLCSTPGIEIKTGDKTETNSSIKIDESNPTLFTCEGGNCCHSTTSQNVQSFHKVGGILQCQQSVSPPLPSTPKYKCNKQTKTCEQITNIADYYGPLAQSHSNCSEAPCNMHDTNVQIMSEPCAKEIAPGSSSGDGCDYENWDKYVNINSCDLIKENNGCNDLDNHLFNKIDGIKGGGGRCQLEKINIPKGMTAQIYGVPTGWTPVCINPHWHDMCSTKGCNWSTGGSSPDGIHTTFAEVGNDGYNKSGLGGKTCSIKFALTDKNKNACD